MDAADVLEDLLDEQAALDEVVRSLDDPSWALPTPSEGWTVAHQIAHLTFFDRAAAQAIEDPEDFISAREALFTAAMAEAEDPRALDALTIGDLVALPPVQLLATWRDGRAVLARAAADLDDSSRVEWYGPSMSARSFLTARLMEAWAHGQDVVDALCAAAVRAPLRPPTDRLRHVAHLGVVTRSWSYAVRGDAAPDAEVRVELTSPSGERWDWGPEDATDRVVGPAEDFCLVITQRRHVDDTGLQVAGDAAREWMRVAQAFAGGPTEGPVPRAT